MTEGTLDLTTLATSTSCLSSTYHRGLFSIPSTLASDRSAPGRCISRHVGFSGLGYFKSPVGRKNHYLGLIFRRCSSILPKHSFVVDWLSRDKSGIWTRSPLCLLQSLLQFQQPIFQRLLTGIIIRSFCLSVTSWVASWELPNTVITVSG